MDLRGFLRRIRGSLRRLDTPLSPPNIPDDAEAKSAPSSTNSAGKSLMSRMPGSKQQVLERLEGGYERLLLLCETIDAHLQSQRQQGQQVAVSLERLSTAINQVPNLLAEQGQCLQHIAEQVGQAASGADRLAEAVDQLIPTQRSQNDLLASVNRQLDEAGHTNSRLAEILVELKGALQGLVECQQEQGRFLADLAQVIQRRDQNLTSIIERHSKLSRWVLSAALAAAATALAIALVTVLSR